MAPIDRKTHFPLVQSLRGLASLWVVLFHCVEGHHIDRLLATMPPFFANLVFRWGHFGVPVFFALSGFVIAHSLRDVPLNGKALGMFTIRRSVRLDPPYWVSMIVVLAFAYLSARVKHVGFDSPDLATVGAHFLYLQLILGEPAISPVYWTLTYEIQFYLFFAIMLTLGMVLGRGSGHARKLAWIVMYLLALISALGAFDGIHEGIFLNLWAAFFVGVLAYKAIDDQTSLYAGLVLMVPMLVRLDAFMLISAATAALLCLSSLTGLAQRQSRFGVDQWLGKISYSLYLIHNPLTGATGFMGLKLFGASVLGNVATLVAILVVSLAGAWVFWLLIERPAHKWTRKIKLR